MQRILIAALLSIAVSLTGCEKEQSPAGGGTAPAGDAVKKEVPPADRSPGQPAPGAGHGGEVVELGETTVNGVSIKASRDEGAITAGGDAPIDIWINGGLGEAAAVRFWIGTEDAKGSIKAKADVEAGHWHTHTEVPDPIPAGSKLWVEVEGKDGGKSVVSFDLN